MVYSPAENFARVLEERNDGISLPDSRPDPMPLLEGMARRPTLATCGATPVQLYRALVFMRGAAASASVDADGTFSCSRAGRCCHDDQSFIS